MKIWLLIIYVSEIILFNLEAKNLEAKEPSIEITVDGRSSVERVRYLYLRCVSITEDSQVEGVQKDNNFEAIEQCLLNSKSFSKAKINEELGVIKIFVEDRWNIFPLPFFMIDRNMYVAGAVLIDGNFGGWGHQSGILAYKSNRGFNMISFYNNPHIFYTPVTFGFMASSGKTDMEMIENDKITDAHVQNQQSVSIKLGVNRNHFTPAIQYGYKIQKFKPINGFTPPENQEKQIMTASCDYDRTAYKFFFNEGFRIYADYGVDLWRNDSQPFAQLFTIRSGYEFNTWSNHSLSLGVIWQKTLTGNKVDAHKVGSGRGLRAYSTMSLWVDTLASNYLDYQIPVFQPSWGTSTIAFFTEGGRVHLKGGSYRTFSYFASGIGAYLYMKAMAIPGIGIETGWYNQKPNYFVRFAMGRMGF